MNLIACKSCGVVLEKHCLNWSRTIYREDFSIDESKAIWNGEDWVPKAECPVCHADVPQKECQEVEG